KSLIELVASNSSVQRLLVHILLANKGLSLFCLYAVQLVRRMAAQALNVAGEQHQEALSFAFALIFKHMASFDGVQAGHGPKQQSVQSAMLDQYSRSFCPLTLASQDAGVHDVLDYSLAVLARRSAQIWSSPLAASKTWHPMVVRLETALSDASNTRVLYLLSLLYVASPAVAEQSRSSLIKMLASFARAQSTKPDALCAAATAVFSLIQDSRDGELEALEHVRSAKAYLSSKIVGMWLSSLSGNPSAGRVNSAELLERAARQATKSVVLEAGAADSLSRSIELAKAGLSRIGRAYSLDTAVDVTGALGHLWLRAADKRSYAADHSKHSLLARIVSADDHLRVKTCEWVERKLLEEEDIAGQSGSRVNCLAVLLRAMAASCMRETEGGRIAWDGTNASRLLSLLCLRFGACLFAATGSRAIEMAEDSDLLFIANVFIQGSEDCAAVDSLRRKLVKAKDKVALGVRATLLRSMVLRFASFPTQIDAFFDSFAALAELVQLSDDMALTSVLASAMEHCVQSAKGLSGGGSAQSAKKAVLAGFRGIETLCHSICLPFDKAEGLDSDELHRLAERHPLPVYRLLAFAATATHALVSAAGTQPDPSLRWFAVLRHLLDCRLFGDRMQVTGVRDLLALTVSGLWDLAKTSLSRWSASLDDYLSLDQLECLMGVYGGTRSLSDRVLLRVIGDYEHTTRQSIMRVALAFGPNAASTYLKERIGRCRYLIERDENDIGVVGEDTLSNALLAVDSGKLFRTVLNFPVNATSSSLALEDPVALLLNAQFDSALLARSTKPGLDVYDSSLVYDPQFMLAWVWTVVSARVLVDIRRLFECNAAGLALVALSSADPRTRKLAYYILDVLYARVADAKNLSGQRQYLLLLDALRNAIAQRSDAEFPRIPYAITIFVATSLNVMMHPEHAMFADVNQLLLRRPYLRLSDIPLLRAVMRSSSNARKQRVHVLRQAAQSARAFDQSLAAFKSADFVNVTLALASNPLGDVLTSKAAMTLLFHLTSSENPRALALHVSKHSSFLVSWIRQQVALEANALVEASSRAKLESDAVSSAAGGVALLMQPALAALGNLTALMRVVLRAVANYPLSVLSDGTALHDRFWVVQSSTQVSAPGQTVAIGIVQQILAALAASLKLLGGGNTVSVEFAKCALILIRTCADSARLLSDMQAGASDQQPPV
ncbi:hypothetical protein GGI00_002367, partial [Coemansia sp. RSA 2681]